MLTEFLVSNYRSFSDEQVLSLVPALDKSLSTTNLYINKNGQKVLCGGAVYGPNAAGKSNLIKAMLIMKLIIQDSATKVQAGQKLNVQAFALDPKYKEQPTAFEISVLIKGIRYQYGFSLTPSRVIDEWLLVYKSYKPQKWFSRIWDDLNKTYTYDFSVSFLGQKEVWKQATRENALFFSTAMQLNCEQLRPLWDWITNAWHILPAQTQINLSPTLKMIEKGENKDRILDFLNAADFGIKDIEVVKGKGTQTPFAIETATGKVITSPPMDVSIKIPKLKHTSIQGDAIFNLADESDGTQRIFSLSGFILDILESGWTLVVDELETSMHPLLVRHIIGLFFSPKTNPNGAQIIFTTHNTSLLDHELLRRDQIWFAEKSAIQATVLTSLAEFSARKNEAFEKGYLEGRYGALPILRSLELEKSGHD
jgi:AAA15 family ATPase/GTPase